MLATEILVEFGGLIVPVRKVRYQIHPDQTQIGADVVGLEIVDGRVASVHFAEVKFRSTGDTAAADSAHDQLSTWHSSEFAQIVFFVGARLEESNPGLYEIFFEYLRDATVRVDQFTSSLCGSRVLVRHSAFKPSATPRPTGTVNRPRGAYRGSC